VTKPIPAMTLAAMEKRWKAKSERKPKPEPEGIHLVEVIEVSDDPDYLVDGEVGTYRTVRSLCGHKSVWYLLENRGPGDVDCLQCAAALVNGEGVESTG